MRKSSLFYIYEYSVHYENTISIEVNMWLISRFFHSTKSFAAWIEYLLIKKPLILSQIENMIIFLLISSQPIQCGFFCNHFLYFGTEPVYAICFILRRFQCVVWMWYVNIFMIATLDELCANLQFRIFLSHICMQQVVWNLLSRFKPTWNNVKLWC